MVAGKNHGSADGVGGHGKDVHTARDLQVKTLLLSSRPCLKRCRLHTKDYIRCTMDAASSDFDTFSSYSSHDLEHRLLGLMKFTIMDVFSYSQFINLTHG